MVSDHVYSLCTETETASSTLSKTPTAAPGDIVNKLYGQYHQDSHHDDNANRKRWSPEDLARASKCGRWGPTSPSSLFLKAFADSLKCLDSDPMAGMVSPPLMGSHGVIPLTIIAPLVDVIRHCSNLIARAQREVFFITCSWAPSVAQRLIKNALTELSRRAGKRGHRVVVKLMYDKAGPSNILDSHPLVKPETYSSSSIQLPPPEQIPNIDLEVVSLHKIILGTLHAKFCVVDRTIACIMSNNMEDNDNLEMMTHLEGPIVDGIYDTAVITWHKSFHPPLPAHEMPAKNDERSLPKQELECSNRCDEQSLRNVATNGDRKAELLSPHTPENPQWDSNLSAETKRIQAVYSTKSGESRLQAVNRQLNLPLSKSISATGPDISDGEEMTPYIPTLTTAPMPMALVSRPPYGAIDSKNSNVPQNEAWLSLIRNARKNVFIQTPDLNAAPLMPAIAGALRRGVEVTYYVCFGYNDSGEMIPGQGGTNDQVAQALLASLPPKGPERALLHIYNYVGKDQDHPIHHSFKSRSCHIKLLIVDDQVGIQGSGNQDTQSWFHSQEMNVMIDSQDVCQKWREGIERNQNTKAFGRVAADGIWRDGLGNPGSGYMGNPGKMVGLLKGVYGMMAKMKGMGGF